MAYITIDASSIIKYHKEIATLRRALEKAVKVLVEYGECPANHDTWTESDKCWEYCEKKETVKLKCWLLYFMQDENELPSLASLKGTMTKINNEMSEDIVKTIRMGRAEDNA